MIFNTTERKGVLWMMLLITGILVIPRQIHPGDHPFFLLPEAIEVKNDSLIVYTDSNRTQSKKYARRITYTPLELNTADSTALVKLKGIGPYYAMKILRYRERLGGFQSVEQLKELKLTYLNVDSCAHFFTVNPNLIIKRDFDSLDFKTVLRHPYLEYEDVQLIFNAKRKYGHISYSLLEEKKILVPHKLKKIQPYFR